MTRRKTKTADEEARAHFATPEARSATAWDTVREMRKDAREMANKGKNPEKAFAWTQRQFDADRNMQVILLLYVLEWFAAARVKREALEARVAELEKCPVDYKGVYEEGVTYQPRSLVSDGGSMWFTPSNTKSRPNEGAPWVMCVKAGRSAK